MSDVNHQYGQLRMTYKLTIKNEIWVVRLWKGRKYISYIKDLQLLISGQENAIDISDGKLVCNEGWWIVKVICANYNHELINALVGHPYASRLKPNEQSMLVNMTNTLVKLENILMTLKESNEDNATTIKQFYNVSTYQW